MNRELVFKYWWSWAGSCWVVLAIDVYEKPDDRGPMLWN
jgi:hypothetical protein